MSPVPFSNRLLVRGIRGAEDGGRSRVARSLVRGCSLCRRGCGKWVALGGFVVLTVRVSESERLQELEFRRIDAGGQLQPKVHVKRIELLDRLRLLLAERTIQLFSFFILRLEGLWLEQDGLPLEFLGMPRPAATARPEGPEPLPTDLGRVRCEQEEVFPVLLFRQREMKDEAVR